MKEKFSVSLNSAIEQQGNGVYFSAFNFSPAIRIQFGLFEEINILLRQQLFSSSAFQSCVETEITQNYIKADF